jgi:predicted DNA-binding transcriptional regulator YafY
MDKDAFLRLFPGMAVCFAGSTRIDPRHAVAIRYTNHRGETAWRIIIPHRLRFGSSPWHVGEQWFLEALDVAKGEDRSFALADIHEWARPEVSAEQLGTCPGFEAER